MLAFDATKELRAGKRLKTESDGVPSARSDVFLVVCSFCLQRVCGGFDLLNGAEAEDIHVRRPEELLVVPRVDQFLFN